MNEHVRHYFTVASEAQEGGHYHQVIPLEVAGSETFESAQLKAPLLPKGWWELTRLPSEDRIEFVRGFWFATLPYMPGTSDIIGKFFGELDDIGVILTQQSAGSTFLAQMIYSMRNNSTFFRGLPPALKEERELLRRLFPTHPLPEDFIEFLKIHNGFSKVTDTGLIPAAAIQPTFESFQERLSHKPPLTRGAPYNEEINPSSLIPFYQSFGTDSYQCFFADWYPQEEMGNLYYSGQDHTLSNFSGRQSLPENLAFPSFLHWLAFYLDGIGS